MSDRGVRVGIVGGSIAGLAAAVTLLRAGVEVEVFERTRVVDPALGTGMGVDLALVEQVTRRTERVLPHLSLGRRRVISDGRAVDERTAITVSAYPLLREHLRSVVPDERYRAGQEVVAVDAPSVGDLRLWFDNGDSRAFDAVIVADGRRSRLRGLVAHQEAERYAGYVLLRGLIPEGALPEMARSCFVDGPENLDGMALHIASRGRCQLIAYPVPGEKGEVAPGQRRLSFGWYYGCSMARLRIDLLGGTPAAEEAILGATTPSPLVMANLLDEAEVLWSPPYAALVRAALQVGTFSLHPIYEHVPDRLASGRIALAGDAAHLASPITGSGGRMALLDALALAEAFSLESRDVVSAFRRYQGVRLAPSVAIVAHGRTAGANFRSS